jgi:thiol-disulfide isomerase/thioredoxin
MVYFAMILVFCCYKTIAYESRTATKPERTLKPTEKQQAIEIPFADGPGYVQGGAKIDCGVLKNEKEEFNLSDLKGKVVIVMFVTVWCPNCPASLEELERLEEGLLKEKISDVKIIVLNIGEESIDELREHYKHCNVRSLDLYQSLPNAVVHGLRGVPACFVFDKTGKPVWGCYGFAPYYSSRKFINYIRELTKRDAE